MSIPVDGGIEAAIRGAMDKLGVDTKVTPSDVVPPVEAPVEKKPKVGKVGRPKKQPELPVAPAVSDEGNGELPSIPVSTVASVEPTQKSQKNAQSTLTVVTPCHMDVVSATESEIVIGGDTYTLLQLVLKTDATKQSAAASEPSSTQTDSAPKAPKGKSRVSHHTDYDDMTKEQLLAEKDRLSSLIAKEQRESEEWHRLKKLRRQVRALLNKM